MVLLAVAGQVKNALIRYHFFIHTRITHPVGRPFAVYYSVQRGPRFLILTLIAEL